MTSESRSADPYANKWWALLAVSAGVFMSTIDGSIVNIALKTLQDYFKVGLHSVEWVVLAYLLGLVCLLPIAGRMGDMIGKRAVYVTGFVIFTIGSVLCGLSWNIEALIVFRVVQAIGAAMIQGVGSALLIEAFPPTERGQALGYIGSSVAAGILAGPVLGGFLLKFNWQSIFFVNLPIGIAAVILVLRAIPNDRRRSAQRFDIPGAVMLGVGLLLLLLALTEGQIWGFGDWRTLAALTTGLLLLPIFVWWQLRTPEPMIQLGLFRNPIFSLSLTASFASFLAGSFNFLLLPYYLQNVLGYDPQRTGLTLIASPIVLSLISPLSGRLSDRFGSRWLGVIGLAILSASLFSFASLTTESSQFDVIMRLILLGLGFGLFQSPNNSMVMGSVARTSLGVAGGLLAVMRTLGQTVGVAIAGAIWATQVTAAAGRVYDPITAAPPAALVAGMHDAMVIAALLAALGIIPTLARGASVNPDIQPRAEQRPT